MNGAAKMGFKKTAEGRVFFQGSNDDPRNEQRHQNRQKQQQQAAHGAAPDYAAQQTQIQILQLLKALNEKLQSTQMERKEMRQQIESYRTLIENLDEKSGQYEQAVHSTQSRAERAEKLAAETMKELEETRKLLVEVEERADRADRTAAATKRVQKDQVQKVSSALIHYDELAKRVKTTESRQEELGTKIDEAVSQQGRLTRKIDKAVEDRARFMRKIERIEETVLQTRDSLNAKAMVLLTDQGVAPEDGSQDLRASSSREDGADSAPAAFWNRATQALQQAPLALLLVVAVLGGWLIFEIQKPRISDLEGLSLDALRQTLSGAPDIGAATGETLTEAAQNPGRAPAPPPSEMLETADNEWNIEQDTSAFAEQPAGQSAQGTESGARAPQVWENPETVAADDIGALDLQNEDQVLALLEEDPDALAAELNAIEPGETATAPQGGTQRTSTPANLVNSAAEETAPPTETPQTRVAALPPQTQAQQQQEEQTPPPQAQESAPPKQPESARTPARAVQPAQDSRFRRPDPALPDMIRQIEEQAFNGVPEAQHDLAAVYTAGHGGVEPDYSRAAYWFRQAAEQGVGNARYNLGVLYHQGLGMEKNLEEAIYWYTAAAEAGHPEAQYNLGIAYIEGIGVEYNPAQAAVYFENAAANGVMEAAYNLGLIYENGLLGEPKPDEALLWYKTAADEGSPEARAALEQLARSLDIKLADVERLAESMEAARSAGNPDDGNSAAQAPVKTKIIKESKLTPGSADFENAPPQGAGANPQDPPRTVSNPPRVAKTPGNSGKNSALQGQEQILVAQVQEYLMRMGLYPGPADGVADPLTNDAVRSYQALNNLHVNGQVSESLLTHMLANGVDNQ
jgi:TPR repeat protein